MRNGADWAQVQIGEGLRLLLGWRDGRRGLDAQPVELTDDVSDVLRAACRDTLKNLGDRTRKRYSGTGNIDSDEFLALEIKEPPADEADESTPRLEELVAAADVVRLAQSAFARTDFLTRDDLFEGGWFFYAVIVELSGETTPLAFIRQYNPQRGFSPGWLFSFHNDALAHAADPVFMFDQTFDVVLADDEIAVLSPTAFRRLFADVEVISSEVPGHVETLSTGLGLPIASGSTTVLIETCQDKLRLAARIRKLSHASHLHLVTKSALDVALIKHGLPADHFGDGDTVKLRDSDAVREFIDVLEKRYYEEDFTDEHMRADNASPRTN